MAIDAMGNISSVREIPKQDVQKQDIKIPTSEVQTVESKPIKMNQSQADGSNKNSDEQENPQMKQKHILNVLNDANTKMKNTKTKCEFSYHEATKRVSIKIIDKETEEVIREVPPEETLKMIEKIWELAGIMVDEKR